MLLAVDFDEDLIDIEGVTSSLRCLESKINTRKRTIQRPLSYSVAVKARFVGGIAAFAYKRSLATPNYR